MSTSPVLTDEDFENLKDALRCYLDYLISSGLKRENPKLYEHVRLTNLHVLDFAQYLKAHRMGAIEIAKIQRSIY